MWQRWERLLFLHWEWDASEIQATLPEGLEVDCFDGRAYLGVIPFFMRKVRPRFCPPIPVVSDFLESNVRTYVRDQAGRPGVWFYSLDCNQPIAVAVARSLFRLPYFSARMRAQVGPNSGVVYYDCRRQGTRETAHFEYKASGQPRPARVGSLEEFLVERYRLFAAGRSGLLTGRVRHSPYDIAPAEVPRWSALPLEQAGFAAGILPPDHALVSPGVDVAVYPLGFG